MSWRIDDTDPTQPVRLDIGGPFPLRLTVGEYMRLMRDAPKAAGAWEYRTHDGEHYGAVRWDVRGVQVADVWHQSTHYETGIECWGARTHAGTASGVSLADAMAEADRVLRAAGWLLEEG